ncbi:MAG: GNAT family N-acetyltransferase [Eubacteriales bacterium]|nr:GNAT family N-acetyltransferase [Eubacteriales bacterium]
MIYRINEEVNVEKIATLREAVGWNRMENELRNPLMTSYIHIAAYEEDVLIGYIDSISNGVTDAYIQDLMVHPKYQGKGVGTELMNQMIACIKEKHIYMVSVIFEEEMKSFYEKFGFYTMLSGQLETYESR